jgi:hypothetical protein
MMPQSLAVTQSFANASFISIPSDGTATPYPSTLQVSGATNPVAKLTVTLKNFSHDYAEDVFAMVVAPNGQNTMLVSYSSPYPAVPWIDFDDGVTDPVPFLTSIASVPLPSDYAGTFGPYDLPPCTLRPYGRRLRRLRFHPTAHGHRMFGISA